MPFFNLQCKSIYWFLFEGNIDMKKVKKTYIFDQEKVATEFNQFFANIDPKLPK